MTSITVVLTGMYRCRYTYTAFKRMCEVCAPLFLVFSPFPPSLLSVNGEVKESFHVKGTAELQSIVIEDDEVRDVTI
jgi:hypothetical protein